MITSRFELSTAPKDQVADVDRTVAWLRKLVAVAGPLSVASIGPEGTSADGVLRFLTRPEAGASGITPVLCADFDDTMARILDGSVDLALVPSAYRDATAFHWHADLVLVQAFVHATPTYGIAASSADLESDRPLVAAAMSEVWDVFHQLAPAELQRNAVLVPAASTSAAARMVSSGCADLALCNELGRRAHGLTWVRSRPGVNMVWMLFCARAGELAERIVGAVSGGPASSPAQPDPHV